MHCALRDKLSIVGAALAALLGGCILGGKEAKRGSEIGNELGVGLVCHADGRPAQGARVRLYPVGSVPLPNATPKAAAPTRQAFTDARGRYRIDTLPEGEFNILVDLDNNVAYSDSILGGPVPALPSDTLRDPGSVTGRILMQPNHDPRSAVIQLLGTNRFANVDEDGYFTLAGLAEGRYSFRITTTEPGYTPLFGGLFARTGRDDTLPGPLALIFTDIPVATGLAARFDTAHSVVTFSWSPARYKQLDAYLVYRGRADEPWAETMPLASVRDTVFRDTLDLVDNATGPGAQLEYRVRILNKSGQIGLNYGSAAVTIADPGLVRTRFTPRFAQGAPDVGITDSVRLIVNYSNPTRKVVRLEWRVSGSDSLLAFRTADSLEGEDTFAYAWPDSGVKSIRVRALDEAGGLTEESFAIRVHSDQSIAKAGADTLVEPGAMVRLHGMGEVPYGVVAKLEWDIGNQGRFVEVAGGDTVFPAPVSPNGFLPCVLRVTSYHGLASLDTLRVYSGNWKFIARSPEMQFLKTAGDRLVTASDAGIVRVYDPAMDTFGDAAALDGKPVIFEYVLGRVVAFYRNTGGYYSAAILSSDGKWNGFPRSLHEPFLTTVRNESVFFLEKRDWTMTRWNDNGTTEPYGDPDPDPSGDPIRPSTPPSVLRFFADTLYYVPGKSSSTGANVSEFRFFPMGEAGWITGLTRTETGPVHADFIHEGRWYLLAENGHLESMSPPWGRFQRMAPIPGFSFPYTGSNDRPFFAVHGDTAFLLYRDAALVHVLSYDITGNAWSKVVDFPNLGGKWAIADVAGKIYLANGTTLMRLDY